MEEWTGIVWLKTWGKWRATVSEVMEIKFRKTRRIS